MPSLRQHDKVVYSNKLTSFQIWKVLNNLLFEAAAPLSQYSNMSVETAISCLVISTNNRRKIAAEEPKELLESLFSELACSLEVDADKDLELLDTLLQKGVERNIIVDHIAYSMQIGQVPLEVDINKLRKHVDKYLTDYETFKKDVVFRFYFWIENFSKRNQSLKSIHGLQSTKADMFHVYIISSMRAIDRFVPFMGTLTSYIKNWFSNAEGSSRYITYDNEVFSLNRSVRKSVQGGERNLNNKAIPIADRANELYDDPDPVLEDTLPAFLHHVARLPNSTIAFMAQNLAYPLSKEQTERIKEHNRSTP